ncbi:MAG: zincin-like metallopeptidase domain-containing protein [Rhodobacteraceae bacterium]|nr:zincin-like metallopeptidase domain-containing protein [Paracoccaceae bacterium]
MKKDIYQNVTDKILSDLDRGELTWLKPWSASHMEGRVVRPLRHNSIPYNGINVLMLWVAIVEAGYTSPFWMTYKQATAHGAQVRKGERGSLVVYANTITKTEETSDGSEEERRIPFMKGYTVFNACQIDGLDTHFYATPEPKAYPSGRIGHAEAFFSATEADLRHGGNSAHYAGTSDHVQMPVFEAFRSPEAYYATLAHELIHWTKHKSRLDRDLGRKRWGDEGYAREELVAELGAAFLCADLMLTPEPEPEHAAYIQSWLKVLKRDKRAIFSAAAHAQRAADYLHSLQPQASEADPVPDAA